MTHIQLHAFGLSHWFASALNRRRLQQLSLLLCIVGATELSVVCQIIGNPQSAVDNLTRSSMHVDPSTGALQFQIPLVEYRGRGEASLPVVLHYSSKLWNIKHLSTLPCNGEPVSSYYAEYAKSSASGWTSSVGWFLPTEDLAMESYEGQTQQPATVGNPNLSRIMRKYVTLPDGSRHEMRRDEALHSFGENQSGVYYAVDGSRMRWDLTDSGNHTLFLPNGSRIATINGSRQYIDRNGNLLTFDSNSSTWTDTLGRSIGVPFAGTAPAAGDYTYTLPGGLTYTLRWRNLGDVLTDPTQQLRYKGDAPTSDCTLGSPQPNTLFSTLDAQRKILKQNVVFNPVVLWQIELPNITSKYTFTYNVYGEIDKVVYPTGGNEQFTHGVWEPLGGQLDDGTLSQANRGVLARVVSDGVNTPQTWFYNGTVFETGVDPATAAKSFTGPDGTVTKTWYYKSRGTQIKYGFDDARTGMAREVRVYNSSGVMLRRTLSQLAMDGPQAGGYSTATRNARVTKTVEIILDTGGNALAAATEMTYDPDLNVTSTKQYDYVSISQTTAQTADIPSIPNGDLLRTAETDYLTNDASYRARNMLSLPTATRIKNGAGTILAQKSISYDEPGYPLLPCEATTWSDPSTTARGNATTTGSWLNTTGAFVQTHAQYDQCGNIRNLWDAKNNQSQVEYSSAYSYAYPTLSRSPVPDPSGLQGSAVALVTTTIYDFNTGLVTSTTDANNQTTSFTYDDPLKRPTLVTRPIGGGSTIYEYDDTPGTVSVKTKTALDGTRYLESCQYFDGLGRTIESRQYEDGTNYIATQQEYDSMGRAFKTSNPFRPWQSEGAVWTTTGFDALGRVTSVTTPDSAVVSTSYSGNTVTVTDQAGKKRKSVNDGLGRLTQVYEDPTGLNYLTSYSYDVLDNLTSVSQGVQTRTFVYDSLKRLTSATNPESGTVTYAYDDNGNLSTKTDARSIVATHVYDALNRVTSRSYSDGTPTVTYAYDTAGITNSKGRLTSVSSSVSTYNYGGYDAMGRVSEGTQTLGSQTYSMGYGYDLSGHVKTMTYPSGRTVNYAYDNAGRANSFTGNLGDGTSRNYATGIIYDAGTRMTKEQFGTAIPIFNKLFYNSRGQLSEIRESTSYTGPTDTTWNRGAIINHYSDTCWGMCSGLSMTDNNGNLKKQAVYIPNDDQISSYTMRWQQYDYDSLNRLNWVREIVDEAEVWRQTFTYDRFGNRTIDQATTWGAGIPKPNFTVNPANNRLGVPGGQTGTMTYDAAGNLTTDTYSGAAVMRAYDAENRMTSETQANNYVAGSYTYDGDGRRVKRIVNGTETWQVYGLGGELLAEYAQNGSPPSPQKEYGYRNGQLLITTTAGTSWGSPPTLHDNPLVVTETTAQSRHITELRAAIDALRTHLGMSAFTWQHAAPTGALVKADPILEMRTALDQALGAPSTGYSAGLAQGLPIKAIHIQDLRDRVLAAWSSGSSTQINWLVSDQLGTPRIIFDQSGSLATVSRHDYLPFGEELGSGIGGRSGVAGYGASDGIRQKFTGQERDDETGLDYFGARYFSGTQGRFTSPDPLLSSGRVTMPQSWNRYAYTLNNPLRYVDPTGLYEYGAGTTDEQKKKFEAALQRAREQLAAIEKKYTKDSTEYKDAVRALNAYGDPNQANGVTVSFATLSKGTQGDTLGTLSRTGANTVDVRIDLKQADSGNELLATIAHEGSHVQDKLDYQGALLAASNVSLQAAEAVYNGPLRVTHGASETRAYGVSSVFAEFTLGGGTGESAISSAGGTTTFKFDLPPVKSNTVGGESIWKSSWQKLDIATIRANRTAAIAKGLSKDSRYAPKLNTPIQ